MKVLIQWQAFTKYPAVTAYARERAFRQHKLLLVWIACAVLSMISVLLLASGSIGKDLWFGIGVILFTIAFGVYIFWIFPTKTNREIEKMLPKDKVK